MREIKTRHNVIKTKRGRVIQKSNNKELKTEKDYQFIEKKTSEQNENQEHIGKVFNSKYFCFYFRDYPYTFFLL